MRLLLPRCLLALFFVRAGLSRRALMLPIVL